MIPPVLPGSVSSTYTLAAILQDWVYTQNKITLDRQRQEDQFKLQEMERKSEVRSKKSSRDRQRIESDIARDIEGLKEKRSPQDIIRYKASTLLVLKEIQESRILLATTIKKLRLIIDLNEKIIQTAPKKLQDKIRNAVKSIVESTPYYSPQKPYTEMLTTCIDLENCQLKQTNDPIYKHLTDPSNELQLTFPEHYDEDEIIDGKVSFLLNRRLGNVNGAYLSAAYKILCYVGIQAEITRALAATPDLVKVSDPKPKLLLFGKADMAEVIANRFEMCENLLEEMLSDKNYIELISKEAVVNTCIDENGRVAGLNGASVYETSSASRQPHLPNSIAFGTDFKKVISAAFSVYKTSVYTLLNYAAEWFILDELSSKIAGASFANNFNLANKTVPNFFANTKRSKYLLKANQALGKPAKPCTLKSPQKLIDEITFELFKSYDLPVCSASQITPTINSWDGEVIGTKIYLERIEFSKAQLEETASDYLLINADKANALELFLSQLDIKQRSEILESEPTLKSYVDKRASEIKSDADETAHICSIATEAYRKKLAMFVFPVNNGPTSFKPLNVHHLIQSAIR